MMSRLQPIPHLRMFGLESNAFLSDAFFDPTRSLSIYLSCSTRHILAEFEHSASPHTAPGLTCKIETIIAPARPASKCGCEKQRRKLIGSSRERGQSISTATLEKYAITLAVGELIPHSGGDGGGGHSFRRSQIGHALNS